MTDRRLPFDERMKKLEKLYIVTYAFNQGERTITRTTFVRFKKPEYFNTEWLDRMFGKKGAALLNMMEVEK
ncbi:hypothetical protein [Liquorilactobacillus hordei]|uniref:hypothetical protein n=1 Tax=Liquorilactobacillus hordei TaxID=468911 RepID=UPI0039EB8EB0